MPRLFSTTPAMKRFWDFNLALLEAAVVTFMECKGQREVFLLLGLERPAGSGKHPHARPRNNAKEPGLRICGFMISLESVLMRWTV